MKVTICFDMDGTIADLYNVENWLPKLNNHDPSLYKDANVMHNMSRLARYLNKANQRGHEVKIISWLAKDSTPEYDYLVAEAKRKWIEKHLPSVNFANMHFIPYGTPKTQFADEHNLSILFDDSAEVRAEWGETAYTPNEIFEILKSIMEQ